MVEYDFLEDQSICMECTNMDAYSDSSYLVRGLTGERVVQNRISCRNKANCEKMYKHIKERLLMEKEKQHE